MDSFHRHLNELERLLSDDDMEKRQIKESVLCYAAHLGSISVVEALNHKGVGKDFCCHTQSALSIAELLLGPGPVCTLWMSWQVQNVCKLRKTVTWV